jgi:hypothetical protein
MFTKVDVKAALTMDMLGTVPKNKDVYKDYIAKKATDKGIAIDVAEELETVLEMEEKGWTGFHEDEEGIFIYDYMVKGNIKANVENLIQSGTIKKITAYKTHLDRWLFVNPRKIRFYDGETLIKSPQGVMERPLRAMTMQGPRVSLTKSDIIKAGSTFSFEIAVLDNPKFDLDPIREALDYSQFYGIGQWRGSGGYGKFTVEGWEVKK